MRLSIIILHNSFMHIFISPLFGHEFIGLSVFLTEPTLWSPVY